MQDLTWPELEWLKSSSFNRGPMSSSWEYRYWLMRGAHWSHRCSRRRSCIVDSTSTVERGLQRGSPGSRLLGMPRICRSCNDTCWEYSDIMIQLQCEWGRGYMGFFSFLNKGWSLYSVRVQYLLARITTVEKHTRVQFRCNHTFKCQFWLLGEKHNYAKTVLKYMSE